MKLDDKVIGNLAEQLGLTGETQKVAKKLKDYEDQDEEKLVQELRKMQEKLRAADIPYEKQIAAVESLMPLMNEQQKARLKKIIGLLKKTY